MNTNIIKISIFIGLSSTASLFSMCQERNRILYSSRPLCPVDVRSFMRAASRNELNLPYNSLSDFKTTMDKLFASEIQSPSQNQVQQAFAAHFAQPVTTYRNNSHGVSSSSASLAPNLSELNTATSQYVNRSAIPQDATSAYQIVLASCSTAMKSNPETRSLYNEHKAHLLRHINSTIAAMNRCLYPVSHYEAFKAIKNLEKSIAHIPDPYARAVALYYGQQIKKAFFSADGTFNTTIRETAQSSITPIIEDFQRVIDATFFKRIIKQNLMGSIFADKIVMISDFDAGRDMPSYDTEFDAKISHNTFNCDLTNIITLCDQGKSDEALKIVHSYNKQHHAASTKPLNSTQFHIADQIYQLAKNKFDHAQRVKEDYKLISSSLDLQKILEESYSPTVQEIKKQLELLKKHPTNQNIKEKASSAETALLFAEKLAHEIGILNDSKESSTSLDQLKTVITECQQAMKKMQDTILKKENPAIAEHVALISFELAQITAELSKETIDFCQHPREKIEEAIKETLLNTLKDLETIGKISAKSALILMARDPFLSDDPGWMNFNPETDAHHIAATQEIEKALQQCSQLIDALKEIYKSKPGEKTALAAHILGELAKTKLLHKARNALMEKSLSTTFSTFSEQTALTKAPQLEKTQTVIRELSQETGLSPIWSNIEPTGEFWENTYIPKSFKIRIQEQKLWIAPNATEHLKEPFKKVVQDHAIVSAIQSVLPNQMILDDFIESLGKFPLHKVTYNTKGISPLFQQGNWRFVFAKPRITGQCPAIIHIENINWDYKK